MTHNKFWLVWNDAGKTPKKRHDTEESAYKEAHRLASMYPQHEYVVLRAVRTFKADVSVVETDLTVLKVDATATRPKFKVGDFVEYNKCKYEIHEIALKDDDSYQCSFKGVGYKYKNSDTGAYGWISESVLSPWEDESPKHPFKVGDKVKYLNTDVKLVTQYPIETGTVDEIRDRKDGVQRIYVRRQDSHYGFFNKEDLTHA